MNLNKITIVAIVATLLIAALAIGISCAVGGGAPNFGTNTEQTEDTGDCDLGDLYEAKPDADCGGLHLGTPKPKTTKGTGTKPTSGTKPKPVRTR